MSASPRPRVVAIGDSITAGVGDAPGPHLGWAAHVAHALGAHHFVNLAANGTRARDLGRTQVPTALMQRPDIVLMSIGGNDVLRGDFDPLDVGECLADALSRLSRPHRSIVILSLDRIGLFDLMPRAVSAVMARRIAAANDAITTAALRNGATLVDGAAVFHEAGARAWHIDRVHPSGYGHRAVAVAAATALADRWPRLRTVSAPPSPPGLLSRSWWLARNGAPWVVKRSRDLIPHVAQVVAHELLEERRARVRA